ncbi:translation elongation factor Ts [Corynebacterium pyruviciproducens]|uniref:Elongation factor Ts n=2 Tax=Corynebacterium pyruviciproducens TaxID=598660 RepID=S2Z6P5_9CORY|nr:translation elongation factor Ts [Corynebacterium pyruviciproducens]EPD69920.1 elongation factor Ts [Corynebacterium pyruviciproducens ATCC BAA-1742]MDH4657047.1 elongation factor Ts [Corynebacterium pyruviciproducens]MDK6566233.1 translation elongation factor Ts [Corynebacterium pyruviciproducens]MDK7214416.1 translation elongation factor Ts [Corynebacterium pyruviciproducens]WOT03062.1 translation elongation factor Ts [Corynebacterium pyruviciproducens]
MANYTAADVKKLRQMTGSGMLDCKNALAETDGDFDKAVELLRIKGAKDVGKRADRDAAQGIVAISGNTMVEVNAETDFVAKTPEFIEFVDKVAAAADKAKANSAEELAAVDVDGRPAADVLQEMSAKIGEKLQLRRAVTLEGANVATYLHQRSADLPPAVGVLVAYEGEGDAAKEAAHQVCLQVAALKAQYLTREDVPAEVVEKERSIAEQITREEGKPEKAIPKIVEGRLGGFYKDVVLVDQPSVADNKKTVGKLAEEAGITLTGFVRYEVGQK